MNKENLSKMNHNKKERQNPLWPTSAQQKKYMAWENSTNQEKETNS